MSSQRADVALHQHPQRGGGGGEEGEALQPVSAVSGRSAEDLHDLPAALSRQDGPAPVQHGLDTHSFQTVKVGTF